MENTLTLRELQLEELKILKDLAKYLNENNYTYFLCAGTLLGAVRHKGFIPWDDDIDILMPREEYSRLIKEYNQNPIKKDYTLKALELNNSGYPFAKLVTNNIVIESKSAEDKNLWIDIFPIDGYPDDYDESLKLEKRILTRKGMIYLHTTSFKNIWKEKKSVKNRILKMFLKPISMLVPVKTSAKKIQKMATKYKYSTSKYVGGSVWGYGIQERMEKEKVFSSAAELEFEGEKFCAPIGYKEYLSNIYGDYMKLPPEEKRVTHNIIAKKIGGE